MGVIRIKLSPPDSAMARERPALKIKHRNRRLLAVWIPPDQISNARCDRTQSLASPTTRTRRAQVKIACVTCQRAKAKVSLIHTQKSEGHADSLRQDSDALILRWPAAFVRALRKESCVLRIRRRTWHNTFHIHPAKDRCPPNGSRWITRAH